MKLVLAVTGASGALAAKALAQLSPWPVALVASKWGKDMLARECGGPKALARLAAHVFDDDDLAAPISSGALPTAGMVVLPCSSDALARIAAGMGDTLICRAAHCHLKERRPLVLCVRETPWSLIDINNARRAARAGAIVMPLSPPFYLKPDASSAELMDAFARRVLAVLGKPADGDWDKHW
jgi:4-hydroxy-3-polyprenylbenzoate decarboxylase